ncbi:hypothetical protein QBC40DRAFT_302020 [Triangularia verruculosa]|uniref:Uncharacterized protein n=1 Tax=Triangularia verruculosa TaxID=2587418 RepID=A0AAN6X5L8_9PEZI|nr:hypothetical protein QBC40DRAFT_302020 [Triangularia verruculosa]
MSSYDGSFFRDPDEPLTRAEDHEDLHSPYASTYHRQAPKPILIHDSATRSHTPSLSKQYRASLTPQERAEDRANRERASHSPWNVPLRVNTVDENPQPGKSVPPVDANVEVWSGLPPKGHKVVWYEGKKMRVTYHIEGTYYDRHGNKYSGTGEMFSKDIEKVVYTPPNNMDLLQQAQYAPTDYDASAQAWQLSQGSSLSNAGVMSTEEGA